MASQPHPSSDDSLDDEPALKAMRTTSRSQPNPLPADQNILSEPALRDRDDLKHSQVHVDALCPSCGYNRRGTPLQVPCPECGHALGTSRTAPVTSDQMAKVDEEIVRHSVFNEPHAIHHDPARDVGKRIESDWCCSQCGYNLRQSIVGDACPECGHVQQSAPPPADQISYTNWLRAKIAQTTEDKARSVTIAVALLGGAWAVLASMFNNSSFGGSIVWIAVLIAPVVEETMKIALAAWIVEIRPYLFKSTAQVRIAIIASGAMFGILENLYYVNLILPKMNAPESVYLFRWIVCTALHITTTIVSSIGIARVWSKATTQLQEPSLDDAYPWIIAAIFIHGIYNGSMVLLEAMGGFF